MYHTSLIGSHQTQQTAKMFAPHLLCKVPVVYVYGQLPGLSSKIFQVETLQ